ncbi:MAG: hypothetical protein U1E78_08185 [Gammaproteobacteria bacterium]
MDDSDYTPLYRAKSSGEKLFDHVCQRFSDAFQAEMPNIMMGTHWFTLKQKDSTILYIDHLPLHKNGFEYSFWNIKATFINGQPNKTVTINYEYRYEYTNHPSPPRLYSLGPIR